jgi:hypothetical protein
MLPTLVGDPLAWAVGLAAAEYASSAAYWQPWQEKAYDECQGDRCDQREGGNSQESSPGLPAGAAGSTSLGGCEPVLGTPGLGSH